MIRRTALVSGRIAGASGLGGAAWAVLQYALGLERLGWDVVLVEPLEGPANGPLAETPSAAFFGRVAQASGLTGRAALIRPETGEVVGMEAAELRRAATRAEVLLNLSGLLADPALFELPRVRVYVDLDPAFTQLWHAVEGIDMRLAGHDAHVTVGGELGRPDCPVPTCGIEWIPTLPPVILDAWPAADGEPGGAWTTVSNWRGYGSIRWDGRLYGQKAHAFRELFPLPERTGEPFAVALTIHPDEVDDLAALHRHGWQLVDPARAAGDLRLYRDFVRSSKAEIGIAKSGYVESGCGWFSDRSACYLASGRPVVAQETGFSRRLPTGEGLLSFRTLDEAVAAVETVGADWAHHARAARGLAEERLDARRVLAELLEAAGVEP